MFKKKQDKFSLLLTDIAKNIDEAADFLVAYKIKDTATLSEFSNNLKGFETKGDQIVRTIIKELNHAFITPIEREDILQLANSLDDILDGIEVFAGMMDTYNIYTSDSFIDQFTEKISSCAKEIIITIDLLSRHKLKEIQEHAIKIKEHEHNCDTIYRESLKQLFQNEIDPIKVIQYKELYSILEEIADSCQSVANNLETIIMKNA